MLTSLNYEKGLGEGWRKKGGGRDNIKQKLLLKRKRNTVAGAREEQQPVQVPLLDK